MHSFSGKQCFLSLVSSLNWRCQPAKLLLIYIYCLCAGHWKMKQNCSRKSENGFSVSLLALGSSSSSLFFSNWRVSEWHKAKMCNNKKSMHTLRNDENIAKNNKGQLKLKGSKLSTVDCRRLKTAVVNRLHEWAMWKQEPSKKNASRGPNGPNHQWRCKHMSLKLLLMQQQQQKLSSIQLGLHFNNNSLLARHFALP